MANPDPVDFKRLSEATHTVFPKALEGILKEMAKGEALVMAGIDTPLRALYFVAQVGHESAGFSRLSEALGYSATRLRQVWPKRFPTQAIADACAHKPELIANKVYGGRMGNTEPDDGWRYRGRGLIQLTGKNNYALVSKLTGLDLVANPEQAGDPWLALTIASKFWAKNGFNAYADRRDFRGLTRAINGGENGLADRRNLLARLAKAYVVRGDIALER